MPLVVFVVAALAVVFFVGVFAFFVVAFFVVAALGALVVFFVRLADVADLAFGVAALAVFALAGDFLAAADFFSSSLAVAFFLEVDLMRLFFPIDNPFEIGWVLAYSAGLRNKGIL
ncbi:MAG: hypothetical protein QNJ22_11020 [Desulfosarcinaceae bacterium]|nr:hypothetical protein [Desulfosarcinaceae bacterium]